MLKLKLDELFGPEIVAAFQKQWAAEPEAALAQAEAAIRMIVTPRDDRERAIAEIVVGLVGPEPDGLAWLEALAVGSFQLRDNVTYAIGRVGESPARFIDRQRERIARLAGNSRARGREGDMTHAYNDALRLVVASSLLTQMKTGVAAKAALGPAWPLMVAVDEYFTESEKRALYWLGNDASLQEAIAAALRTALEDHQDRHPDQEVPRRLDYKRNLPPGTDVHGYFARKAERASFPVASSLKRRRSMDVPDFILEATEDRLTPQSNERARYRAGILLANLEQAQTGAYAFALALRAERRRTIREEWLASDDRSESQDFDIQAAIWDHVQNGGFLPPDIPVEFIHYLEEDACWAFNEQGEGWAGYALWQRNGYFHFQPEPTKVYRLSV